MLIKIRRLVLYGSPTQILCHLMQEFIPCSLVNVEKIYFDMYCNLDIVTVLIWLIIFVHFSVGWRRMHMSCVEYFTKIT